MFAKIILLLLILPGLISTQPIELTDTTWRNMLDGQWMVEFYAPWCPACQHFKKIWSDFAREMSYKNIKVAAVDIDQYPGLSGRFRISALPSIFHVNNGEFRLYDSDRSLNSLRNYIENENWKNTEPLNPYLAPDSIGMSLISSVFDLSVIIKNAYAILKDQYGLPVWLIYIIFGVGVIFIGIFIGFTAITILDYCVATMTKIYRKVGGKKEDDDDLDLNVLPEPRTSIRSSSSNKAKLNEQEDKSDSTSDELNASDIVPEKNESDTTSDELNASDIVPEKNESEKESNTKQTVRQRRAKAKK